MNWWYMQQSYDEWKKPDKKERVHSVWFHLYKTLKDKNEFVVLESISMVSRIKCIEQLKMWSNSVYFNRGGICLSWFP